MTLEPGALSFSLVDDRDRPVDESVALGSLSLFFFGFTHCRMVCPRALAKLSAGLDALGADAGFVRAFYVTVDPQRDTPTVMREFLERDYPRFVGLSGHPTRLKEFHDALHVFSRRRDAPDDPDGYTMAHTAFSYVFDSAGRYLAHFGDGASASEITAGLRELVSRVTRGKGAGR